MPEIVILSGIPGSGKTTLCKKFPFNKYAILSRDNIRYNVMTSAGITYKHTKKNEEEVDKWFDHLYEIETSEGNNIILDNCYCKEAYIQAEIKRKPANYTLRIIFIDCPLWKAYIRNVWRFLWEGRLVPFKVIRQFKKNRDKINKKKYDKIF